MASDGLFDVAEKLQHAMMQRQPAITEVPPVRNVVTGRRRCMLTKYLMAALSKALALDACDLVDQLVVARNAHRDPERQTR